MMGVVDLEKLPPPARRVLAPDAPVPLRMMAAKAALPGVKPGDIVTVVALLAADSDGAVAQAARTTFGALAAPLLASALGADLEPFVIERLSEAYAHNGDIVGKLLRLPRVSQVALETLAERADEQCGEIIATNEQLMLRFPTVIAKLYMNKSVRMSTADRLIELAVRNQIELDIPAFKQAAAAIANELIPEPSPEPTFDDVLFNQSDALAQRVAVGPEVDTHEVDDEGKEQVKPECKPLYQQLAEMTISGKVRTATLGKREARLILIRDPNRLVAVAAARSPMMKEDEAVLISSSRAVSDDVLRELAMNREFTRNYQVKLNLVSNPRTPFTFAARLVPHLRDNDLRSLGKSKNVPSAVAQAVRQQLERKGGKRR